MKRTTQGRITGCGAAVCCTVLAAAAWAHPAGDKFRGMDTNGDGMVSASEHAAGARKMFTEMDADRDGRVTAAEMDARHGMKREDRQPRTQGMGHGMGQGMAHGKEHGMGGPWMSSADKIASMDTDGDGALSASEHDSGAQARFTQRDTDRNGSLSREEMAAGHAAMKPSKPEAGNTP